MSMDGDFADISKISFSLIEIEEELLRDSSYCIALHAI